MDKTRRNFLKLTGISLAGATAALAGFEVVDASEFLENKGSLKATQWAMVVDVTKCEEDCSDCVEACHVGHNVPEIENKLHEIKWIWKTEFPHAFPNQENEHLAQRLTEKPFMVLCNHCTNPPCVRVCPTQATFKRAEDGIVLMDFHRCIGCRFCMAACPYGSRSFNWRDPRGEGLIEHITSEFPTRTKGVVEKCNFCAEQLAAGELPLCVRACKNEALIFGDINDENSPVREILRERFAIRRKPNLGTGPNVYYVI